MYYRRAAPDITDPNRPMNEKKDHEPGNHGPRPSKREQRKIWRQNDAKKHNK